MKTQTEQIKELNKKEKANKKKANKKLHDSQVVFSVEEDY